MLLLKDHLKYDSETNQLINLYKRGNLKANSPLKVTTKGDGYQVISLKGKLLYVHRVVDSIEDGEKWLEAIRIREHGLFSRDL